MIYLNVQGGLCNRLRAIGSAIKFSKKRNEFVTVLWKNNGEVGCCFEDFFNEIDNERWGSKIEIQNVICSEKELLEAIAQKIGKERCYLDVAVFLEDYIYQEGRGDFLLSTCYDFDNFNQTFDWLLPKEIVNRRINYIVKQFEDNCIGIHIRRTDQKKSIKHSPVTLFQKAMDKEISKDDTVKFYLATDDMEVKLLFEKKYNGKIITNNNHFITRKTKEGMEDAIIDLFALASTGKIYGSYNSSYSETASYIGKVKLEVLDVFRQEWEEYKEIIERYEKVAIYGAGFIGRQIYCLLKKEGYHLSCFVVSDMGQNEENVEGIPVIVMDDLKDREKYLFILGAGNTKVRAEMSARLKSMECENMIDFDINILSHEEIRCRQ